jgi:GxxExxY protein
LGFSSNKLLHGEITDQILGGCFSVYRKWGFGFLERVYANSLEIELSRRGLHVRRELPVQLRYLGVPVGAYRIDMLVNDKVIVEVKAQSTLSIADEKQLTNYLKATDIEVGIVFNFGPDPKFQRLVLTSDHK